MTKQYQFEDQPSSGEKNEIYQKNQKMVDLHIGIQLPCNFLLLTKDTTIISKLLQAKHIYGCAIPI